MNINPGRPIVLPRPEELAERGATDGGADRAAGHHPSANEIVAEIAAADIPTVVDTHRWLSAQAAAMTINRHEDGIARANADVGIKSNEVAAAAKALTTADEHLATAQDSKRGFDERATELADPDLALTLPSPTRAESGAGVDPSPPNNDADGAHQPPEPGTTPSPRAWRFPLRRDLHPAAVVLLLVVIAGAEFALNARAFQSVREVEWLVLLLAGLVGVGMVALAHRIGSNIRDLLETVEGAGGRSRSKMAELGLEVPGLVAGIVGVATIRSSYFKLVGITIPTAGLVCIQAALAIAAIGITMAGRNLAVDESRDRGREVEEREHGRRQPLKALVAAQNGLVEAERSLRSALQGLVNDFDIQLSEVGLGMAAYLRSYATAAGIKVVGTLPEVSAPDLVTQAQAWLATHQVGTRAHLELPYSCAGREKQAQPVQHDSDSSSEVTPIGGGDRDERGGNSERVA